MMATVVIWSHTGLAQISSRSNYLTLISRAEAAQVVASLLFWGICKYRSKKISPLYRGDITCILIFQWRLLAPLPP